MKRAILAAGLVATTQLDAQRPPDKLLVTTYEKAMINAPPEALGLDSFYKK